MVLINSDIVASTKETTICQMKKGLVKETCKGAPSGKYKRERVVDGVFHWRMKFQQMGEYVHSN